LITKLPEFAKYLFISAITAALLAMPAFCFSETYGNMPEDAENTVAEAVSGPVDITLVKNGETYNYTYFPVECGEFLQFAGVTLSETEKVSVPENLILYDDIVIDVSSVQYVEYTVEQQIDYGYDITEVDTIPKGTMNVIYEGAYGRKLVTYLEKRVSGVAVSKEVVGEEVIVQSENGKAEYGVGGTYVTPGGDEIKYSYKRYMEATAYTYMPGYTTMTTATGATLAKGIVAVDPREIPMHTKMYITSDTVDYGYGVAEDTGGVIKGNIIDLAYMSYTECINFGRRYMWVYFLEE
jgi:3D (Asp-Asp-Asp) domain-containing protein